MKTIRLISLVLISLVLFSIAVSATTVDLTPNNPTDNDNLSCNISGVSQDNLNNYRYFWYVNGHRDDGVGNTWIYLSSRTNVGDSITCAVFTPASFFVGTDTVTISPNVPVVNHPPSVNIVVPTDNSHFSLGTVVNFTALVSDQDMGETFTYNWDFGDGSSSVAPAPAHMYNTPGRYAITVTVSDGRLSGADGVTIFIDVRPNQNPVASISVSDHFVCVGETVTFDGSRSYDPDGRIAFYRWDFGDGSIGSSPVENHSYSSTGWYTARLQVTDYGLATDTASTFILVGDCPATPENQNPVANAGPDRTITPEEIITFDGSGSSDPDGTIVSYSWDFGDGNTASGVNSEHSYSADGTYVVTLTVTDNDGATNSDTAVVTVATPLQNPVAVIDVPTTNAFLGFPLTFSGSRSYDPDGAIVSYSWDFGDGSAASSVNATHNFVTAGIYNVTLTVTDNDGLTGISTVSINAGNVDRGPDYDKQRVHPFIRDAELRDFRIGRVMPVNYKLSYNRGDNVVLLVKLTNEGILNEILDLKLTVPEFNYVSSLNDVHVDFSQVKWVMVTLPIPASASPGRHVVELEAIPNVGNIKDNIFWEFVVA